jgi:hypothetical protein
MIPEDIIQNGLGDTLLARVVGSQACPPEDRTAWRCLWLGAWRYGAWSAV